MAPRVREINAITLTTPDMALSVEFYAALGFELQHGGPTAPFTTFTAGTGFLNLQLDDDGAGRVWGRVIFWVDDVDAMHDQVLAAGHRPEMAPSDAPWGERYFHVRDPSGRAQLRQAHRALTGRSGTSRFVLRRSGSRQSRFIELSS